MRTFRIQEIGNNTRQFQLIWLNIIENIKIRSEIPIIFSLFIERNYKFFEKFINTRHVLFLTTPKYHVCIGKKIGY